MLFGKIVQLQVAKRNALPNHRFQREAYLITMFLIDTSFWRPFTKSKVSRFTFDQLNHSCPKCKKALFKICEPWYNSIDSKTIPHKDSQAGTSITHYSAKC